MRVLVLAQISFKAYLLLQRLFHAVSDSIKAKPQTENELDIFVFRSKWNKSPIRPPVGG
jgi:hypothetical protein